MVLREHGGPEVLHLEELPDPVPGPGEVRVRVAAVAMNRLDIWVRNGLPHIRHTYPFLLGADVAGTIDGLGPGVADSAGPRLRDGDEVVVSPGVSCGRCVQCLSGRDNLCRDYGLLGEHRSGGYARVHRGAGRQHRACPRGPLDRRAGRAAHDLPHRLADARPQGRRAPGRGGFGARRRLGSGRGGHPDRPPARRRGHRHRFHRRKAGARPAARRAPPRQLAQRRPARQRQARHRQAWRRRGGGAHRRRDVGAVDPGLCLGRAHRHLRRHLGPRRAPPTCGMCSSVSCPSSGRPWAARACSWRSCSRSRPGGCGR